ncbi:ABC transporter six-transmembrane domain-containing protein [uncultured Hoeflea sp.]|uniref:ABC transporter six-transmembrane domain-containing protein n=1 Tax=uncultured Hoeflea sp. TaxID=538666 RepID=UPI00262D5530|nr:ABC transporter six-transmembrane domain-containing protein [uncultured Hoeflea sp.]
MLTGRELTIASLMRVFTGRISLTWAMILAETCLMALVPLFIGLAIDGLLAGRLDELWLLAAIMAGLILIAVLRRIYDTRVYGAIRVELGREQAERSNSLLISTLNARLGMGRELVEFLEHTLPGAMAATVQLVISVLVLAAFSPVLALAGGAAALAMVMIYALFHRRFFRLNGALNQQTERQVSVLEQRAGRPTLSHLLRLKREEIRLSDTEALLYGAIFFVLSGLILFNLWFSATQLITTAGTIFAIISYSWEFVESALALPATLQHWSRLSEITRRLNGNVSSDP